jgi:ubiquitin carboxyl-terminal hydrolase 34
MESEADTALPVTPKRTGFDLSSQEPNSDRVTTLNLRVHPTESIPSSPPETPSKMTYAGDDTRKSVESESDALSTIPAIETPSSSASAPGSPEIEVMPIQDYESDAHSPAVQLIGDDDGDEDDMFATNLMESFPWRRDNLSLEQTVRQIERALQYGEYF